LNSPVTRESLRSRFSANQKPPPLSSAINEPVLPVENFKAFPAKVAVNKAWKQFVAMIPLSQVLGFGISIENNEPPAGAKTLPDTIDHQFGILKFVVGVRDQNRIRGLDR
jgi:hypothetical protein